MGDGDGVGWLIVGKMVKYAVKEMMVLRQRFERRFSMGIGAFGINRFLSWTALIVLLVSSHSLRAAETVPAWDNTVRKEKQAELLNAYRTNEIRVEWAGQNPKVAELMPANLVYQFAVIGDGDVTNRVRRVLQNTLSAMTPDFRAEIEKRGLVCPTLQWVLRWTRARARKLNYMSVAAHPAAFIEADFVETNMVTVAKAMDINMIPLQTKVAAAFDRAPFPISRVVPQVDCPDIMPEETFANDFCIANVIRCPDRFRRVRLSAGSVSGNHAANHFSWTMSCSGSIKGWVYDPELTKDTGHGEVLFDFMRFRRRADILVFAQAVNGLPGLPAIVSYYKVPFAHYRKNSKGWIESVAYVLRDREALYDLSPVWIPREWTDEFEYWEKRYYVRSIYRKFPSENPGKRYARNNELTVETYSSEDPKQVQMVRFVVSPTSNQLSIEPLDEVKNYKSGEFVPRKRGDSWLSGE